MKRILTLVGAIMGIVYSAIGTALTLIFFLVLWAFLNGPNVILAIITVFVVGLAVTALVLDILATRCFACTAEQYAKRRKLLVTTVVFNLLPSSSLLFLFLTGIAEFYFFVPAILLGIVSSILLAVDIRREKDRVEKLPVDAPHTPPTPPATPTPPTQPTAIVEHSENVQ